MLACLRNWDEWSQLRISCRQVRLSGCCCVRGSLGAMAAPLPTDKPIPWSTALPGLAVVAHYWLDNQREAAQ
jgi:hypothetical protein